MFQSKAEGHGMISESTEGLIQFIQDPNEMQSIFVVYIQFKDSCHFLV